MVKLVALLAWGVGLSLGTAFGAPPPEVYQLIPLKDKSLIDPALDKWFAGFQSVPDYSRLSSADFNRKATALTSLERDILLLIRADSKSRQQLAAKHWQKLNQLSVAAKQHPLYPYYVDEVAALPGLSDQQRAHLKDEILRTGGNSCPQKDLLLDDIDAAEKGFSSLLEARTMLGRIAAMESPSFRRKALDEFLDVLKEEHRQPLRDDLVTMTKDFDSILEEHEWLAAAGQKPSPTKDDPTDYFLEVRRLASQGRCSQAKAAISKQVKRVPRKDSWEGAQVAAERIDRCYRRKGVNARVRFYKGITADFRKAYGFKGYAFAYGRQGALLWGVDRFSQAKQIYSDVLKQAVRYKERGVEAHARFTMGRILENEGRFEEALQYYRKFTHDFPDSEDYASGVKAIILMAANLGRRDLAMEYVEALIASQSLKQVDDRDTSVLSFALFWGGRLAYEAKHKERAEEYWHRGATEFYSTFYGAMSHYLLERLQANNFMLQPSRGSAFDSKVLLSALTSIEQSATKRIDGLLRLGLKERARCEIAEISDIKRDSDDLKDQRKILVNALYRNVAGDWLESIKLYGNLSRTFRHSLAPGFERLLFPKSYGEYVQKYTDKLNVDPELIYAIIRQESVFNPKAVSSAGARGLMQLMPATARLEARKLRREYVSRKERSQLIKKSRNRDNLLEAHTNVTIGVHHVQSLLEQFKSPIYVLTSYNASPRATSRWLKNFADADKLEFIERIPYKETKAYVKLVLRNYFYYKRWYRPANQGLPVLDQILPESLRKLGTDHAMAKKYRRSRG